MSSKYSKGSEWRKWDLHFHTPASYDYKDKSVTEKQIVDTLISKGVSVVAITDHHTMDVPLIRKLQEIAGDELTVLPGIELRSDVLGRPSIHYIGIFPENCNLEYVWTKLQNEVNDVEFNKKGGDEGFFVNIEKMSNLIHELGGLVSIHAGNKSNSIDRELSHENEYLMQLKKETAYHADIFEVGKVEDQAGYREKVFPKIERTFPMILCSDNHDIKNYHVKASLWIKADPTFEGLKQILHEPNHRVHIGGEYPPFDPPNYIQRITLNFPDITTVGYEDKKYPFCLRGKTHELPFSPNYTCIIGGRGTGKSTILNLLVLKLDEKKLDKSQIQKIHVVENRDVKHFIDIDSKGIDFEYLGQNQIVEFANDTDKLTKSLIDRLEQRDTHRNLSEIKNSIHSNVAAFSDLLGIDTSLRNLKKSLVEREEQLSAKQNIQNTYESEEYRVLIRDGEAKSDALQKIQSSQKRFLSLQDALTRVRESFQIKDEVPNKYDTSFNEMINGLNALLKLYSSIDFSEEETKISVLSSEITENQKNIRYYLEGCGVSSKENLNQLSGISEEIGKLKQQIQEDEQQISQLEKNRLSLSNCESEATDAKEQYEQILQTLIEEANKRLAGIDSKYVKLIRLEYKFSLEKAKEKVYERFCQEFQSEISSSIRGEKHLSDKFYEYVDIKEILKDVSGASFQEKLNAASRPNAQTTQFLRDLFSLEENYKRLRILCQKNYYNPVEFGTIDVTYDGRPLKDTSFGQRCTAVLILLLLLGNYPIIIDEPEAHLDSLLISNYLVNLIKEQKKHRQIIFATHNANFVINGDAELIYVLEEGENGTTITPTTIENKEHKDKLIALEGGKEAFLRREQRLR
jgi:predicted ATPase